MINAYFSDKMRRYVLILSLLFALGATAQNAGQADKLFTSGNYAAALTQYSLLHAATPKNALYIYRLARCEQELGYAESAILHFEQAGDRYALRNYFLGCLYYDAYRFEEAKACFEAYAETIDETHERYEDLSERLRRVNRALRYYSRVENVDIIGADTFPKDSLLRHLPLSAEQGRFLVENDAYIYENQRGDIRFFVAVDGERSLICRQERLLDEWSAPDTLPLSINQFARQGYPFLLSDGRTLYFAAQSDQGLGGWDLYITQYNPSTNTYLTPEMLGMPFSSLSDDYLYYVDETRGRAYLLTDRNAPDADHLVLYTIIPNEQKRIFRDADDAFLRDFARMRIIKESPKEQEVEQPVVEPVVEQPQPAEQEPLMRILILDKVYTSPAMLHNDEARRKAETYIDLLSQISEEQEDLQKYRAEYASAVGAERRALEPLILSLEKDVLRLRREAKSVYDDIVALEKQQ